MKYDESRIQVACVKWFNYQYPGYRGLLFAVPNGGARNAVTGRILKAEGVVAGVADLILLVPIVGHNALCIEMKTEKGRQQASQKEWQEKVESAGAKYVICRSFEQFVEIVTDYMARAKMYKMIKEL